MKMRKIGRILTVMFLTGGLMTGCQKKQTVVLPEKEQKEEATGVKHLFDELLAECPGVQIEAPDTMLFLIIELASSASYSTILDSDPVSYEELKPYLNASIRAIIKSHMYTTQRHEEQKI